MVGDGVDGWVDSWEMAGPLPEQRDYSWEEAVSWPERLSGVVT